MKPFDESRFYTPKEVAEMFKLSKQTIYNLINRGELEAIKFGNTFRIPGTSLNEYVKQSTTKKDIQS